MGVKSHYFLFSQTRLSCHFLEISTKIFQKTQFQSYTIRTVTELRRLQQQRFTEFFLKIRDSLLELGQSTPH